MIRDWSTCTLEIAAGMEMFIELLKDLGQGN